MSDYMNSETMVIESFERMGRRLKELIRDGIGAPEIRNLADSYTYDLLASGWPVYAWAIADLTDDMIRKGSGK